MTNFLIVESELSGKPRSLTGQKYIYWHLIEIGILAKAAACAITDIKYTSFTHANYNSSQLS